MKSIERRLVDLEARLARLRPPPLPEGLAWVEWIADADLDWLEELYRRVEGGGPPATEAERLRCISIQAMALSRMASVEAP
jgi:hypothetical protein